MGYCGLENAVSSELWICSNDLLHNARHEEAHENQKMVS